MYNKLKEYFLWCLLNFIVRMNIVVGGWGDFLFELRIWFIVLREFFLNKEVYLFVWSRIGVVKNNYEVLLMVNYGYKVGNCFNL